MGNKHEDISVAMDGFHPERAADILKTCQENAEEIAAALGRALGGSFELEVQEPQPFAKDDLSKPLSGGGLAIVLEKAEAGAAAWIAQSSLLLPEWYAHPDETQQSQLATLAQELGMLLLPEDLAPDGFSAIGVSNLGEAMDRADPADSASYIGLKLTTEANGEGTLYLVWPFTKLGRISESDPKGEPDKAAAAAAPTEPKPPPMTPADTNPSHAAPAGLEKLPSYTRSLLKIEVPVIVNLATKREFIREIIELGPGTIIKFEKSCEELLEMNVGGVPIAAGEAVKVDDKFGIRINSMVMPNERFQSLSKKT